MKLKNKKIQVALLTMWTIPIILSLVVIANTSESASQANFKHLMKSIPSKCNVRENKLICDNNIFTKAEVEIVQDFRQNILKGMLNPKLGKCRLFASHQSAISGLIPVKYYQADDDYKMTVFCSGQSEVYTSIFTYASKIMNEEFIKNKSCEKIQSKNPVLMKIDNTFKVAEKGITYMCDKSKDLTDEVYSPRNMLKELFKQDCAKKISTNNNDVLKENEIKCGNLFEAFSENQLKKEKTGFIDEHSVFREMSFMKN